MTSFSVSQPCYEVTDSLGSVEEVFASLPEITGIKDFSIEEVFLEENNKNALRGVYSTVLGSQSRILKALAGRYRVAMVNCDLDSPMLGTVIQAEIHPEDGRVLVVPRKWALGYQAIEESNKMLLLTNEESEGTLTGFNAFSSILEDYWTVTQEEAVMTERDRDLPDFDVFVEMLEEERAKTPTLW